VTTRGGVKAASIAGAIFNHKDNKKGQQDVYRFWFEEAGIPLAFPDTSNIHYGTHCIELPHLADVFVAFLKGASATWDRFTSEFVPGGIIDEATDLEKDLAWMPATNDLNEGALGSYRVFMCYKPRTTLHKFNA